MTSILTTLTVGIPAYNEESNIKYIINSVLNQRTTTYILEKIIVISDGGSDSTCQKVKEVESDKIQLIERTDRKGQSTRQNEMFEMSTSDILVLLNADVQLDGNTFLEDLIKPITEGADLCAANMLYVKPLSFFESVITYSMDFKNYMYENLRGGKNIYTCHGAARAFSKKLYSVFRFEIAPGEDANSYLYAVSNNFKYAYAGNAICRIRCPSSFKDHIKQSTRFYNGKKYRTKTFDENMLRNEYKIDLLLGLKAMVLFALKDPIRMFSYCCVLVITKVLSYFKKSTATWNVASSSKRLVVNE